MRTPSPIPSSTARGRRPWFPGGVYTVAVLVLLITAGCDNFSNPTELGNPAVVFEAALEPLGAELHVVTIPNAGIATVVLNTLEPLQVADNFNPSVLGLTIRLARLDNNCEDGAAFGLAVGQSVVFDLAETTYCLNVAEPGIIPEGALLSYSIGVILP